MCTCSPIPRTDRRSAELAKIAILKLDRHLERLFISIGTTGHICSYLVGKVGISATVEQWRLRGIAVLSSACRGIRLRVCLGLLTYFFLPSSDRKTPLSIISPEPQSSNFYFVFRLSLARAEACCISDRAQNRLCGGGVADSTNPGLVSRIWRAFLSMESRSWGPLHHLDKGFN